MKGLRILQIGTGMPGWAGTEKYILDLVPLLIARGHEVIIACRPASEIEKRSQAQGLPIVHLTMRRTHDWKQLPEFVSEMRGFDVVHIHSYIDYIVPAAAANIARVPVIIMTRHLPHPFRNRWTAFLCSKLFYDGIISVSDYVSNILKTSGVTADRVFTVKNAIDVERWADAAPLDIRQQLGIPGDSFLLAAAGRLVDGKGFDILLRAIGQARRAGTNVCCLIAGPGDTATLDQLRLTERLENSVWFLGFRKDVPSLYAAADAIVVPSEWPEPFGYSAIEGLAAGKAVIATRVGGLPEVVTPDCGVLVPGGDVEALAKAIQRVASGPELRRSLAANARSRAQQFPTEAWVSGIESVYYEILARKKHNSAAKSS